MIELLEQEVHQATDHNYSELVSPFSGISSERFASIVTHLWQVYTLSR